MEKTESIDESNRDDAESFRDCCQPISESATVVARLVDIWDGWFPEKDFMSHIFEPMWMDENTSGDYQITQIQDAEKASEFSPGDPMTDGGRIALVKLTLVMTACAFAVQAMREGAKTKPDYTVRAWSYVSDANRWLGILQGYLSATSVNTNNAASALGRKGAAAAHAENRAMKASVMIWCNSNMADFKSMDAAAQALAGKVVPVTFRTARDWIAEWKKVRSGGTP